MRQKALKGKIDNLFSFCPGLKTLWTLTVFDQRDYRYGH